MSKHRVYDADGQLVEERDIEIPAETVNAATLRERARAALAANADYLALATPTVERSTAQVRALTRQVNALIRLTVNALDSTE